MLFKQICHLLTFRRVSRVYQPARVMPQQTSIAVCKRHSSLLGLDGSLMRTGHCTTSVEPRRLTAGAQSLHGMPLRPRADLGNWSPNLDLLGHFTNNLQRCRRARPSDDNVTLIKGPRLGRRNHSRACQTGIVTLVRKDLAIDQDGQIVSGVEPAGGMLPVP
jgi:hypothetical protein